MFPNRYSGTCFKCSKAVAAGDGFALRNGGGRWIVACRPCGDEIRSAADAAPAAPEPQYNITQYNITQDAGGLVIRCGYDPARTVLLRAMPGSKWNPDRKVWTCSGKTGDLARVIELAEQAKLTISPEIGWRAEQGTPEQQAAAARCTGRGLYPYQVTGVHFLAGKSRAMLADDMGVGKTVQALMALDPARGAVVVCPASVKGVWAAEAARWRPDLRVAKLKGRNSFRLPVPGELLITNYDILPASPPEGLGEVALVWDECHFLKNRAAQRSKKAKALAAEAFSSWGLTGTPLANRPFDLFGTMASVGCLPLSFRKFVQLFHGEQDQWGGWTFGSPDPELAERLRATMLRRTKSEVLGHLPPKRWQVVESNGLDKSLVKDLDALWNEIRDVVEDGELPAFEEVARVRAKLAAARIPMLIEEIECYEEANEPIVVFSAHREPIDTLAQRQGWATITGDTSPDRRAEIVARFQSGDLRGVGLTIQAGGVGLTLTRASNAIFVDRAWGPADNIQAEDRIHRIGQSNACLYKILISNHPLERRISDLLEQKIQWMRESLDADPITVALSAQPSQSYADREEAIRDAIKRAEKEAAVRQGKDRARRFLAGKDVDRAWAPSAAQKDLMREAYEQLALSCDGARSKDGAGFNKPHARASAMIFTCAQGSDEPVAWQALRELLRVYRKTQLGDRFSEIFA